MRMFHVTPTCDWSIYTITDPRVVRHAQVVRLRVWDQIFIQYTQDDSTVRHTIILESITKHQIVWTSINSCIRPIPDRWVGLIVGILHDFKRMSFLVEKCAELGVHRIVFWWSDYSQLSSVSNKKLEKLRMVALQAVEQSNSWIVPHIEQISDLRALWQIECVVCAADWSDSAELWVWKGTDIWSIYAAIWPEWWRTDADCAKLRAISSTYTTVSLGESILRTETACIVATYMLGQSLRR